MDNDTNHTKIRQYMLVGDELGSLVGDSVGNADGILDEVGCNDGSIEVDRLLLKSRTFTGDSPASKIDRNGNNRWTAVV